MLSFSLSREMRCVGVPGSPNIRSNVDCGFTETGRGL
jgi:hypothetical protein